MASKEPPDVKSVDTDNIPGRSETGQLPDETSVSTKNASDKIHQTLSSDDKSQTTPERLNKRKLPVQDNSIPGSSKKNNASACKRYRCNMTSEERLTSKVKDRKRKENKAKSKKIAASNSKTKVENADSKSVKICDRLRARKLPVQDKSDVAGPSGNSAACKRYRLKMTPDEKLKCKLKDCERKRKSKVAVAKSKIKVKRTPASLKRKLNNNNCMRRLRANMTSDAIAERRRKDLQTKRAKGSLAGEELYPFHNEEVEVCETDRTYLSGKVLKYKENLKDYGASDCSSLFANMLKSIKWNICSVCHTRHMGISSACFCTRDSEYTNSNLMRIGEVPIELSSLSTVEQLLIAKVHPVVQVYRLRGGQCGYSGHVINFFQDIKAFAKVLPHSVEHISGIVKVCCQTKSFHKDFSICKDKVLKALLWLKNNNSLYKDIEIDYSVLSSYPAEFQFDLTIDLNENCPKSVDLPERSLEEDIVDISTSSIPECNMISAEEKLKHNLKWPEISHDPIDEMSKSRYIAMAFPTLFPYGIGDISEVVNDKITSRDYFQYLMSYHDGRFASHKIFPYFAWNSVMRWECMTKGTVYMRKHPDLKKVNVNLLKELMKTKNNIGKDVMVYSSSIRSTRNFWYTRSSELQDMINQIDLPTIFFTISAADFHWPRLYDLLKEMCGIQGNITETERHKLMFDNPQICSDYFFAAAEIFINEIMLVYFNVKDHWYRYEWQLRGSPHVHGVLWLAGAVNVRQLQTSFDNCKQQVIDYFDKLISCQNPNTNYVITPEHPCRVRIEDVIDREDDLAALVNTVQRHTVCSLKTCLRKDRRGVMKCKHHFPKVLREKSDIVLSDRKYYEFEGSRNDDRLNKYNDFTLVTWRGNGDFTGILSPGGFKHYLGKYASKPESKSLVFHDIFLEVVKKCSAKASVKSAVQKTLMSSLVERDYSAQEVHHLLSGHKLYSSSRSFVTLNLSNTEWFHHISLNSFGTDNFQDNCNQLLNSYSKRPAVLSKVSLMDFVKLFNYKTYQRKRGRPSIVRVFPRLNLTDSSRSDSDAAVSRQLCILYCPWNTLKDLPQTDDGWHSMKMEHKLEVENLPYYDRDLIQDQDLDDSDHEECFVLDKSQDDWMKVLTTDNDEVYATDLGSRDIDVTFPWKSYTTTDEEQIEFQSFVKNHKQSFKKIVPILPVDINFNGEQNEILAFADSLAESYKVNKNFNDINRFMVCQANAGCGKTVTIQGIVHLVSEKCGDDSIIVIAPTAAAAVNAGGRTIHSALHVSVCKEKKNPDLSGESLHRFQQEFINVRFIIIEEFSMVGCTMLNLINRRCMQMRNCAESFGGCAVFMFGDVKQLPPVGDKSLCKMDLTNMSSQAMDGYNLFRCVEEIRLLRHCHRQSDQRFCAFLENLSHGVCTEEDKHYISDRFEENITDENDLSSFKNAINLFMKRKGVHDYNEFTIKSLNIPIIDIQASNNSAVAAACSEDVACNLMQNLYLGIGVRVMLRANLWTDAGLVNGTMGNVVGILYNKDNDTDTPDYILVKFDNYVGPVLKNGAVPIPRILRSWYLMDHYCTRIQFPLDLAYGITFHKSQGLTLPKCVIHIVEKEMNPGMYYVGFSRARSKMDLLIKGKFQDSPLFSINEKLYADRNAGEEWLLRKFRK